MKEAVVVEMRSCFPAALISNWIISESMEHSCLEEGRNTDWVWIKGYFDGKIGY